MGTDFEGRNVTNALTGAYLSSFSHASGPMTGYALSSYFSNDID